MANRYPLTLSTNNTQIQELNSADELVVGKKLILDTTTVDSAICDANGSPVLSLPTTVATPTGYARISNANGALPTVLIQAVGTTNTNLNLDRLGTGNVQIRGQNIILGGQLSTASSFSTSTAASLTLALSSAAATTATIPSGTVTLVDLSSSQTLSSKTLSSPTLTTPRFATGGSIADANGNELILFPATVASAVNEITISNAATTGAPSISSTGTDANINLNLNAKGSGNVVISAGTTFVPAAGTTTKVPLLIPSGVNVTTQQAGAIEYDGNIFYATPNTSVGRSSLTTGIYTTGGGVALTIGAESTNQLLFPAANDTITLPIGVYYLVLGITVTRGTTSTVSAALRVSLGGGGTAIGTFHGTAMGGTNNAGPVIITLQGTALSATSNITSASAVAGAVYVSKMEGIMRVTTAGTFSPRYSLSAIITGGTTTNPSVHNRLILQELNSVGGAAALGNWA
jgi:hypothetical protein